MHSALWDFSLKFYDHPDVQNACLALQDGTGCDVNLVLYALWRGRDTLTVSSDAFAELDALVRPVRDLATVPLRTVRREMKAAGLPADPDRFEQLRSEVKTIELHAEKLEQRLLAEATPQMHPAMGHEAARDNLSSYSEMLGVRFPAHAVETLLARLD